MKWLVLVFGPNHQAKDIQSLIDENNDYKNLNIIVVLVTNSKLYLKNEQMYVTGFGFGGNKAGKTGVGGRMGMSRYGQNMFG